MSPTKWEILWVGPSHLFYQALRWFWGLHRWSVVKNLPANAGSARDVGSIPELGRSHGVENGNPLQYACLENSLDRRSWWATVPGVTNSHTWLKDLYLNLNWYRWALQRWQIWDAWMNGSPQLRPLIQHRFHSQQQTDSHCVPRLPWPKSSRLHEALFAPFAWGSWRWAWGYSTNCSVILELTHASDTHSSAWCAIFHH